MLLLTNKGNRKLIRIDFFFKWTHTESYLVSILYEYDSEMANQIS